MGENRKRIKVTKGIIAWNGERIADAVKFTVDTTPKVEKTYGLNELTPDAQYINHENTGVLEQFMSDNRIRNELTKAIREGKTPEFTLTGINEDTDSDYYENVGEQKVTCTGVVFTDSINIFTLDAGGTLQKVSMSFNAKNVYEG